MQLVNFRNVAKRYANHRGLDPINLQIPSGQFIGLLGLNGSGKTTCLKLLAGLLNPSSGDVLVKNKSPRDHRRLVAYMSDQQGFYDWMTAKDISRVMKHLYGDFRSDVFDELNRRFRIPQSAIGSLSKGQKQQLNLAAILGRKASLYLLDEPLASIDVITRQQILNELMRIWDRTATIIMATHEIADVETYLDRAIILKEGRIAADFKKQEIEAAGQSIKERFLNLMAPEG